MFKRLLIPTDGSKLSEVAIQKGVQLARSVNAPITGLYVIPKFHVLTYRTEMLEETKEEFARDSKAHAEKYLAVIAGMAQEYGVACETLSVVNDHPYEAIIQTAKDTDCDLIVMASHGRGGVQSVLLGSQTQKVLAHSKIPVLIYR
ncbi:MAG TPA: universal stress protein [Burkholderiales bacterium]|jgi:nucleotide-binding universal stress UspA family protein|nr:universal stress protein [Burkholderiales bacterium]